MNKGEKQQVNVGQQNITFYLDGIEGNTEWAEQIFRTLEQKTIKTESIYSPHRRNGTAKDHTIAKERAGTVLLRVGSIRQPANDQLDIKRLSQAAIKLVHEPQRYAVLFDYDGLSAEGMLELQATKDDFVGQFQNAVILWGVESAVQFVSKKLSQ